MNGNEAQVFKGASELWLASSAFKIYIFNFTNYLTTTTKNKTQPQQKMDCINRLGLPTALGQLQLFHIVPPATGSAPKTKQISIKKIMK